MTFEEIALVCHEANRAYCLVAGDRSQPRWEDAPDWQRQSAIEGVKALVAEPSLSPADLHERWRAHKAKDGWTYGLIKDADKKTHPCMVPFYELPEMQQRKDELFQAVVRVLARLPKGYVHV